MMGSTSVRTRPGDGGDEVTAVHCRGATATATVDASGDQADAAVQRNALSLETTAKRQRVAARLWPCMAALRAQTRVLASGSPTIHRAGRAGGVGGGGVVVEVGSSLTSHGDTCLCPSRPLGCRSRRPLVEVEGGQGGRGEGRERRVGGRKRGGAGGARGMSDRCGALDVALRA